MKKRILSFLLTLVILFSLSATTFTSNAEDLQDIEVIKAQDFSITIPNAQVDKSETTSSITKDAILASSSSVLYLQVELCKNNTTAEVWANYIWQSYTGTAPTNVSVTLNLNTYTSRTSSSTNRVTKTYTNIQMGTKYTTGVASTTSAGAAFWELSTTTKANGSTLTKDTGLALLNRAAVPYPSYTDPNSMKEISEPDTTTWTKVSNPLPGLTSAQRTAFKLWYEQKYCNGVVQDWSDVQVHHIKPRIFGGTHDYSNLVPLKTSDHQKFTSWWVNYNNGCTGCE